MASSSSARGLSLLKAIEKYTLAKPKQWDSAHVFNKVKLISANNGTLQASFTVEPSMCNAVDYLHGGYVSTLVDATSMYAQWCHDKGCLAWTTYMNIVYVNPAKVGDEIFIEASPINVVAGRTSIMKVVLKNQITGTLIAKGITNFVHGKNEALKAMALKIFEFE